MKVLVKLISLVFVFLISLLIFMPKEELYNFIEKTIKNKNIVISNELRIKKPFGIEIKGAEVYYDGLNAAFIKKINFKSFLFFTKIDIKKLRVSKEFEKLVPLKINNINLRHSVLSLNEININADGVFGEFKGRLNIYDKKVKGELIPSSIMKSKHQKVLRQFKFLDGKYFYEFNF